MGIDRTNRAADVTMVTPLAPTRIDQPKPTARLAWMRERSLARTASTSHSAEPAKHDRSPSRVEPVPIIQPTRSNVICNKSLHQNIGGSDYSADTRKSNACKAVSTASTIWTFGDLRAPLNGTKRPVTPGRWGAASDSRVRLAKSFTRMTQ
jgi:hypothetical protein